MIMLCYDMIMIMIMINIMLCYDMIMMWLWYDYDMIMIWYMIYDIWYNTI